MVRTLSTPPQIGRELMLRSTLRANLPNNVADDVVHKSFNKTKLSGLKVMPSFSHYSLWKGTSNFLDLLVYLTQETCLQQKWKQ
uniref:Uncharacterized protein n=1 Tax=Pararge aegeria TaxID=116150 RepID=S4PLM8_9NEOP